MTCREAIQVILETDPAELAGAGAGPLAEHLENCQRCHAAAEAILEGEGSLGFALTAMVREPDLDDILDRALSGEASKASISAPAPSTPTRVAIPFGKKIWRAGATLIPLAAAATLAFVFLGREPQLPGTPYTQTAHIPGLDVEVPEGRNVAVLETSNPDITVLWLF